MSKSPLDVYKSQAKAGLVDRNMDDFLPHFAPDCILRDMSEAEPRVGRDALRDWLHGFWALLESTSIEFLTVVSEGEFVIGEVLIDGLYRGEGAATDGTPVSLHFVAIDQIRDGLVLSETVYGVAGELESQLPSPTP